MRSGARIPKEFINTDNRQPKKCKKCVVCGKALHSENKSLLCGIHFYYEWNLNYYHQIVKFERKRNKIKNHNLGEIQVPRGGVNF